MLARGGNKHKLEYNCFIKFILLLQRLVAAQQRVVAAECAQAAAEGAAKGRPVPVNARVSELQNQLSLAQKSCTYVYLTKLEADLTYLSVVLQSQFDIITASE